MKITKAKHGQNKTVEIDRFSGGRGVAKEGDTVTPKDPTRKNYGGWVELKVEGITKNGKIKWIAQDGKTEGYSNAEDLYLTSSSELQARSQLASVREMVEQLEGANTSQNDDLIDEARQTIQEDALAVEVRGDWHAPGDEDGAKLSEYRICLCTGGPAVQITGELNQHGEPETAKLQHQDWFKPWTDLPLNDEDEKALLTYASEFLMS